jgi:hypothetical protein
LHAYKDCPISRVHKRRAKPSFHMARANHTNIRYRESGSDRASQDFPQARVLSLGREPSARTFHLGLSHSYSGGVCRTGEHGTTCQAGEERRMCVYSMWVSPCGSLSSLHKPHLSRQYAFILPLITPEDYQHGQSSGRKPRTHPHSV